MIQEKWRARLRRGGQVLLGVLAVGYLLVILTDLNSVRSDIRSMANDIDSLQNDVNSIQSDVSSIQSDVSAIADDLEESPADSAAEGGKSVAKRGGKRMYAPRLSGGDLRQDCRPKARLVGFKASSRRLEKWRTPR